MFKQRRWFTLRISVVTPSVRPKGLYVVESGLNNQTFTDFEWLVCAPDIERGHVKVSPVFLQDEFEGGFWSLNRAYNELIKHAKGELIVTLQDWIYVNPEGLQKFWDDYEATGKQALISGVGDQYESVDKYNKPQIKIWSDPRKTDKYGSFYECNPNDAEWNWCAIPKKAFYDIGGMDEGLDFLGYGGDQLQAGERMDEMGYKFYLDQTNESYTIRHNRDDFGGQENWDKNHVLFNGKYDNRIRELKETGKWPVLDYLKEVN